MLKSISEDKVLPSHLMESTSPLFPLPSPSLPHPPFNLQNTSKVDLDEMWKGWICSGNSCRKGGLKGWKHHRGALAAHCTTDWLSLPKPFIYWQAIKPRQDCWSSRVISFFGLVVITGSIIHLALKKTFWVKLLLMIFFWMRIVQSSVLFQMDFRVLRVTDAVTHFS